MKKNNYDAIIVGAGIGGLVCGCYLAKAGMKVLIVEKNPQPGGYCVSFKRRGCLFDAAVHAVQSCSRGSILDIIFSELIKSNKLKFNRSDPTDTIIFRSGKLHIFNDQNKTINNFQNVFPTEKKSLQDFFNLLYSESLISLYFRYRRNTFLDVLNIFFKSEQLKAIFEVFLGNIGSFARKTSAVAAIVLIRQFIIDGGYYPEGGIQRIPDSLFEAFIGAGGNVILNKEVAKILIKNKKCYGVRLKDGGSYFSKIVVSNCDFSRTIINLIGRQEADSRFLRKIENLETTYSNFVLYLTLDKQYKKALDTGPGIWYVPNKRCLYSSKDADEAESPDRGMFCSISSKLDDSLMPSGQDIIRLMTSTNHHGLSYWKDYNSMLSDRLVEQAKNIIPDVHKHIICKGHANSLLFEKYTWNKNGAVCGWMNTVENVNNPAHSNFESIKNLFFVGHWVTEKYGNGGVAMAASSGKKVAKAIILKRKSI
ncbi:MAG: NAD(P)/FAD-dependent oxidoreductase [Candidatus Aceula meridiana]|nr:NAD(P)/FAD-dependent oxidoreductase [Candidatus Aceula meridiana]